MCVSRQSKQAEQVVRIGASGYCTRCITFGEVLLSRAGRGYVYAALHERAMVNQAPRELATEEQDGRAARFVEDYLNAVENLPDAVQRHFSRMLDIDINYRKHVCQVEYFHGVLADTQLDPGSRRQTLGKMNNSLIIMQDLGDEKLKILQTVHDLIEQQLRQLDVDFKNIRPKVEQENNEPLDTSSGSNSVISSTNKIETVNIIKTINNEKVVRRGRRTRNETLAAEEAQKTSDAINILSENQSSNLPGTSNGTTKRTSTGSGNGSGRRKKRKSQNNQNQSRGETPPPKNDDSDDEVDPDEPLYCICNKVSYGKMILCDNDGCEQEWFHFDCMFLTAKPKGKWYCPQCRGSKPNLPKSRSQIR